MVVVYKITNKFIGCVNILLVLSSELGNNRLQRYELSFASCKVKLCLDKNLHTFR